jgi:hypothetical protein
VAWVIAIGVLIFLGLRYPAFGKSALKIGGVLVLVAVVGVASIIYSSNQKQEAAKSLIPLNQVELNNLRLSKSFSLFQLFGEVKNNSTHRLQSITLSVKAYDCPNNTITADCQIIGEDGNVYTYINVPPNQVRALNGVTYVHLDNMPKVKGTFLWSYDLTGTIGE